MRKYVQGLLLATMFTVGLSAGLSSSANATPDCTAHCSRGTLIVCCGNQCYFGGDC